MRKGSRYTYEGVEKTQTAQQSIMGFLGTECSLVTKDGVGCRPGRLPGGRGLGMAFEVQGLGEYEL